MKKLFLFLFVCISGCVTLFAVEYRGPDGLSFDLPEGWEAFGEPKSESFSFANAQREAFLQVFRFNRDSGMEIGDIFGLVQQSLGATGDVVPYQFCGRDGVFGSIEFSAAGRPVSGYAVCLRTETADVAAIAYADTSGGYEEELLSALDSVAFSDDDLTRPGVVSQFMLPPGEPDATAVIEFAGFSYSFPVRIEEFEVAQLVVEREARLLSQSSGEEIDTWKRFYRMVYRDNVGRYKELGSHFSAYAQEVGPRRAAEELLAWLQQFAYERTGTLSDLLNPFESVLRESGDCDARSLAFAILMHYAGYDASLLVSLEFRHALCAVAVPGDGARISTEKGDQVVGETTESVDLGMIASEQADPTAWTVIDLDGRRGPR